MEREALCGMSSRHRWPIDQSASAPRPDGILSGNGIAVKIRYPHPSKPTMNPYGSSFEKRPANPCPICHSEPTQRFSAKFVTVLKCGAPSCGHLYAENPAPGHGLHAHDAEEEYLQYRE